MGLTPGALRIDYSGELPEDLVAYLATLGDVTTASTRPLVLVTAHPDRVLRAITPLLHGGMRVVRIKLRPSRRP
ncbi:MAG: hypothetical protein K6U08_05000 [Firmicutes bacterium]|nr:hypothetical protein [Bacillota bacterium]